MSDQNVRSTSSSLQALIQDQNQNHNHAVEPQLIPLAVAKLYKSTDTFSCILHPSITLSVSQINDDFCDCPDGSDEPGTSACTHLSALSPPQPLPDSTTGTTNSTLALPGFYCKNKGHVPAYIPHTYVNDGVCDYDLCCDGSDEWAGVGGVKCPDKCGPIGKEWRRAEEVRQRAAMNAMRRREEMVGEARALREGVQRSIAEVQGEIGALEVRKEELERKYKEIERRERGKVVASKGKGSKVTILAGLAKQRVEGLRNALVGVAEKRDALEGRVRELEAILTTFKEEYNPNFNDEGVKRAVKAWEDYAANKVETANDAEDRDLKEITKPDSETEGINWAEWETEEESDTDASEYHSPICISQLTCPVYKFEEYLPGFVREWIHAKIADFRVMLVENGILADNANSQSESKVVTEARNAFESASNELNAKKTSLEEFQNDLTKDYGADDIFRALKNTCVETDSGEYTYELCWLDRTSQKSKKGGGNTNMGNFVRFDTIEVDEEVGADGKGLGQGQRMALMYENGQHCWNGPNRQTTVVLGCAEKDEIWKVQEQEKCMYRMDVGTPAVCGKPGPQPVSQGKDEL